jgi:RNA polymerase sigma-70 factor (ECF subfamily)
LISDASNPVRINFVRTLHTNDLYLALACARGSEAAWNRFTLMYSRYIQSAATFVTPPSSTPTEIADNVLVDLFLPGPSGRSRIGSYEGRSSLATWLRVVVTHHAANERERLRNSIGDPQVPDVPDELATSRMDASLRACRYGTMIRDALRSSCDCLTERERLILLLRYDEGLQFGQIARIFGVHQSTITRQIERACKRLREAVVTTLSTKYDLNSAAINECQEDILENPAYSVLAFLEPKPRGK